MTHSDLLARFLLQRRIAYFSMEIALDSDIPTYSGGLGVLAGDTLRSAADLDVPMVGVTLVSRQGYFRQEIDADGHQIEHPDPWEPADRAVPLPAKVSVPVEGRDVWVTGWLYVLHGICGSQPVILLDTNVAENSPDDCKITDYLYGGDDEYRLKQEIVLGIGGLRLLEALSFQPTMYHLNEGHSALLTLQLLRRTAHDMHGARPDEPSYDALQVREACHFTTHTPLEAGHDNFSYELVGRVLGSFVDHATLRRLAGRDGLNTLRLALNLSEFVNGVGKRQTENARRQYPEYSVNAITNGVHTSTWASPEFARLFDRHLPGWQLEPHLLNRAEHLLPHDSVWDCHLFAKQRLIDEIATRCGVALDPDLPTIGYARRMTRYKRPDLLFTDLERLSKIAAARPFQVVLAGKAHPRDPSGRRAVEHLHQVIRELDGSVRVVFVPNYDMNVAALMVAGVDVWLNTPEPPLEASGTSGMKAAINGVPHLSVLDGWWLEGHIEGVTGWSIGNGDSGEDHSDSESLYDKLENIVLPAYAARAVWVEIMKGTISCNASVFHSHHMVRRYAAESYLR